MSRSNEMVYNEVRRCIKKYSFHVEIVFRTGYVRARIEQEEDRHSFRFQKPDGYQYPDLMLIRWTIERIIDLFGIKRASWIFGEKSDWMTDFIPMIEMTESVNLRVSTDEIFRFALKKCGKKVGITCENPPNFDIGTLGPFDFEEIILRNCRWLSRNLLLNSFMNCRRIIIQNGSLRPNDINLFFRKWADENSPIERFEFSNYFIRWWHLFGLLEGIRTEPIRDIDVEGVPFDPMEPESSYLAFQRNNTRTVLVKYKGRIVLSREYQERRVQENGNKENELPENE
uniref:FBA_2 domain-containing protein n=1 Tax=Caenorhabditis tropicalis TaxID=1561998 RepID=A0A1I7TTM3_9PELO